jgi:DNA-binding winged helix-turn-helix (wHTH) protein/tetratricopeptide (TPR) repeat protein
MHPGNSAPSSHKRPAVLFANFRLEGDGTLFRGKTPVHLPPKELFALQHLIAHAGCIVTPVELREALWGDVHVTADSVPKCVSSLRARLEPVDCIQTVYKRGYRFNAELLVQGADPGEKPLRLAILPIGAGYGVPDHLGFVIAEEAISRLTAARPSSIAVLAQDSVSTLARRGLTALEIGRQLGADLALAGSLRALPMHYRMRCEMIRVSDGTQVWVEDVLVERSRVAGLETELVNRLVARLCSSVPEIGSAEPGDKPSAAAGVAPPAEPENENLSIAAAAEIDTIDKQREAYETFQRAHHEWQSLERHRMQDGLQHLLRATELDPTLTGARVDLINLCATQCFYGFMSPSVAADIAYRTLETIPENTPHAESVQPALGWFQFHYDRNLPAALAAFSRSAHLPHDPWVTRVRTMFALSRRRFGEAIDLLRSASALDPYSPWLHTRLAWTLHLNGEAGASVDQIRNALKQFPEHGESNLYGAMVLAFNGEVEQACQVSQTLVQQLPYFDLATEAHAYTLACAGRADEAHSILERLQWLGRERFLLRAFIPAVYAALGEIDAALAELRACNELRCPWFFQMLADPRLKPLHSTPEFRQMQAMLDDMESEVMDDDLMLA